MAEELESVARQVDVSCAKWSEVGPSHGVKVVSVETLVILEDQSSVALKYFEE